MLNKRQAGFTIVELLIVIVVISILAAITIVAYSGIQAQANNAKTQQALEAWVKDLSLYKTDNGHWPTGTACLGSGYLYGVSGSDSTGTAQCRQDSASPGFVDNVAFDNAMKPYTGGSFPTPAFFTSASSSTLWRRGLSYYYGGGDGTQVYITASYVGQQTCPTVGGIAGGGSALGAGTSCIYFIGHITDS